MLIPAPSSPISGKPRLSIDKYIVSYDVKRIPSEQNPHGRLGIGDAVRKLFETVEQHDKDQ